MGSARVTTAATGPSASPPPPYGRRPAWRRFLAWADGIGLAGVSVVVGCRVLDVDGRTPVPQLLAFLPWLLVPAVLGLVLALVARWRIGMAWAAVLIATTGWYVQPYGPGTAEAEGHLIAPVRVLTANVEFGGGTADLIAAIRREKPDLVFVQECEYDCSAALGSEVPDATYPYRKVVEASGAEGSAILSKYPLRSAPGIDGTLAMPGAVALVHDRAVRIQLTHPMPPAPGHVPDWRSELGAIRDYAARDKDRPTLVAGDFNASQDHAVFRRILDAGGLRDTAALGGAFRTPSWPADIDGIGAQIDHVLASDDFAVRSARFLTLRNTDHRALLVELELHSG
ncbi:endonuclease/exonuclease/phosphatase family protein [Streptomyces sp. ISL-98]|uniref:endonuclease/exonuclease/phosphatase family protein n=1 Tax=Streptomyces sp. ISL-98 TaxID=2819192 RepID=UPI001BE8E295|nr:endonuclease/exonuclease/phosphatase family protein [Streptomyces sp. ISL-98]MBT2506570.1 endonuclease/exonuclease/phosphatase family protein [Streptomyces sp. ISL-98]